jgi:hypothetical protein
MFKDLTLPHEYRVMMNDLETFTYTDQVYLIYEGGVYRGITSEKHQAICQAESYDADGAVYEIDTHAQTSTRVY